MRLIPGVILRPALGLILTAAVVAATTAHVRLRYADNGTPLRWENPTSVPLTIQADGSDDIPDGSHATAIRNAIEEWNGVTGSRARIVESTSGTDRRDWQTNDLHLIVFDENNSSGYFSGASSIVAITPITFFTDGRIIDADVVFNGKNFRFTTSGEFGRFDVQDVATHELGHFLGLDHSGVCGATMFPYVDSKVILHRSLALDDKRGLQHIYPVEAFARIGGTVRRVSDGSAISGAHVVALDADGHVAAAILSSTSGVFTLQGLHSGTYTVYADPLDRPVSSANLGGGQLIETDFETSVLGTITATRGEIASLGVHELGGDVSVGLGRVSDDYPLRLITGQAVVRIVRGSGLVAGSSLVCSDPTIALTNVSWADSSVTFTAETPAGAALGHVDLVVTTPTGETDTLVGGLEITPADPVVTQVTPASGDPEGGALVTITGQHFRPGVRVVIGDRIYRDGDAGGCVVTDPSTITLTTAQTIAGSHDVVVIDATGVEGRSVDGFGVAALPVLDSVFPQVGTQAGGTSIVLTGTNFVPDAQVSIDGVLQADVSVESPTRMVVETSGGVAGGPYVIQVVSPGNLVAEAAFTYVNEPDPVIDILTPDEGDMGGGAMVSIFGAGFDEDTRVLFGASTATGTGGRTATIEEFVSSNLIKVRTPSNSVGTTSLLVRNEATGQVAAMEAAFTFTGEEDVDDGGGGCAATIPAGPPTWRGVAGGGGWIALAVVLAFVRSRRGQRSVAPVRTS